MSRELISKVWHLHSLFGSSTPGVLLYKNAQVIFITEEGVQFQAPLADLTHIKWPFLRMGMGFDAEVYGNKYKFSFAKPNASAAEISIQPGSPLPKVIFDSQYFDDLSSLGNVKGDRAECKKWKALLNG